MTFVKPPEPSQPLPEERPVETQAITPWYKKPSILAQARTTTELAGQRPPVINLRDHKELDGKRYAIVQYELHTGLIDGKETEFSILAGFIVDDAGNPIQPLAIMTGAGDIISRVYEFMPVLDAGTPVIGVFRNNGRAWFFD